MTELEEFKELLKEDWCSFSYGDVSLDLKGNDIPLWKFITSTIGDEHRWYTIMNVVTQGPSGKYYRWSYGNGATEEQEDMWIDDGVGTEPVEVRQVPKVVTIMEYEPV